MATTAAERQRWIGALDQGTTSTRFILFDRAGRMGPWAQREHRQIMPQPGWVEHDPAEIWANTQAVITQTLDSAGIAVAEIAALGIANQRETALVWRRSTGRALHNAIVWQDGRVARIVDRLRTDPDAAWVRQVTGLPFSTYFTAAKLRWLLHEIPAIAAAAADGDLCCGTMDSFLIWHLTGGHQHLTDPTNASRTQLFDLATLDWDARLLALFGIPRAALPTIRPSGGWFGDCSGVLAGVPIMAALGDQQAALIGQACFQPGQAKNTYGTGCFVLANTGTAPVRSKAGLITTLAYQFDGQPAHYALEGSIAVAGSLIHWLRDTLGLVRHAAEIEDLAQSVGDAGGMVLVPAFAGLFAPHWNDGARGLMIGLTGYTRPAHIARAALQAIALQVCDVVDAMAEDRAPDGDGAALRVDGGMVGNAALMQIQADLLDRPVTCQACIETSALGAAYAAGIAAAIWADTDAVAALWTGARHWMPRMPAGARQQLRHDWHRAVARSLDWIVRV